MFTMWVELCNNIINNSVSNLIGINVIIYFHTMKSAKFHLITRVIYHKMFLFEKLLLQKQGFIPSKISYCSNKIIHQHVNFSLYEEFIIGLNIMSFMPLDCSLPLCPVKFQNSLENNILQFLLDNSCLLC